MATLRVKPEVNAAVFLSDGRTVTLKADMAFADDDPMVVAVLKATGTQVEDWFQVDGEAAAPAKRRQSVRVENASADPGR